MSITKPRTQKEQIDQLWWVIYGSNGDGMASSVKKIEVAVNKIEKILPGLVTCKDLDEREDAAKKEEQRTANQKNRRKMRWHDKLSMIFTFLATLFFGFQAFGALFGPIHHEPTKIEQVQQMQRETK